MNDDLERLLRPTSPPPTPGLRDRLRAETTRRLRRGRWTWRVAAAATLAACYAGGALTVWLARPGPELVVVEKPVEIPAGTNPAVRPDVPRSPHDLELAAEQADGTESSLLYLEAGRRYGRDFNDWQSALRCYRNALDLAGGPPASDPTNDDWLLAKLKTERRETHANP
jgi:hypothetical protein